jgi:MOSC domain-containing protein YiiM
MPRVLSVNVGLVREVEWRGRIVTTGIWKEPVAGRVALRGVNLDGDDQADRTVHGGADKAVYAYAREDYDFWREHAGIETPPGLFGENLTVDGVDLSASRVGDRWRVGTALLEVAQPRLPCFKLGVRMGDPLFPKRFLAAARPGAYLRIVEEGDIGAGDSIDVLTRAGHDVTLRAMALLARGQGDPSILRGVARLPRYWREMGEAV